MTAGKDEGVKIGGMSLLGAGFDSPEEPPGAETVPAAFPRPSRAIPSRAVLIEPTQSEVGSQPKVGLISSGTRICRASFRRRRRLC